MRVRLYWELVIGYAAMTLAGVPAVIWTPTSISLAGRVLGIIWAAFLVIGGGLCAFGTLSRSWLGEYVGAPLLIVAYAAYSATIAALVIETGNPRPVGLIFLLMGVSSLIAHQWHLSVEERRAAREVRLRKSGDGDGL